MGRGMVVAIVIAVISLGLVLWPWANQLPGSGEGPVEVLVDGPDGSIWNGTVLVSDPASAMDVLWAASVAGNFSIETTGPHGSRYVTSIAEYDESGGGWCVQVDRRDGEGFQDSPVSADQFQVRTGELVRWYWTDGQCEKY